jgi:hypothetical protein
LILTFPESPFSANLPSTKTYPLRMEMSLPSTLIRLSLIVMIDFMNLYNLFIHDFDIVCLFCFRNPKEPREKLLVGVVLPIFISDIEPDAETKN